jgi:hypothetical protein
MCVGMNGNAIPLLNTSRLPAHIFGAQVAFGRRRSFGLDARRRDCSARSQGAVRAFGIELADKVRLILFIYALEISDLVQIVHDEADIHLLLLKGLQSNGKGQTVEQLLKR